MKIKIRAFGIAKDILGQKNLALEIADQTSIEMLKLQLTAQFPEFSKLASLRFAVNEEYVNNDLIIQDDDEIVIIPPVAGG